MCTLIVGLRAVAGTDLWIGANRDEFLSRPASPPRFHPSAPIPFWAPVDELAGGTWLGLNQAGLFVGITNRFGHPPDPTRRSRGRLVVEALGFSNVQAGADALALVEARHYNPFHLVLADRQSASMIWSDGEQVQRRELEVGFTVVTERSLGAAPNEREAMLLERLATPRSAAELEGLLRLHNPAQPFEGACVHLPEMQYATRSSTLITLGAERGSATFRYADGPPCEAPHSSIALEPRPRG